MDFSVTFSVLRAPSLIRKVFSIDLSGLLSESKLSSNCSLWDSIDYDILVNVSWRGLSSPCKVVFRQASDNSGDTCDTWS